MIKLPHYSHVILAVGLIGFVLAGCTGQHGPNAQLQAGEAQPSAIDSQHPLTWVLHADPEQDAQQASQNGDRRLLAFAGRVTSLPGIDLTIYPLGELELHCGYRVVKGTGDIISTPNELPLRSKMHDYAVMYNQKMLALCYAK